MTSTSGERFVYFVFDKWLKDSHPFFRYPILTHGDYEPYLHQAELFYRLLLRSPVRFLIADDVGLGKTIEAIMIIDQLVKYRGVKKILLVVPRVLVKQWVYELRKFSREWGLTVREYSTHVEFEPMGIYVVSVDTFKKRGHLEKFLSVQWDLVIIDEIHKVGIAGNRENLRYKSIDELVKRNPNLHLLGLSATPHRGDNNDYFRRLKLIDPYLVELKEGLIKQTVRAIILKRTKDNVNRVYENAKIFPDAYFVQYLIEPNESEKRYYTFIRELALSILKDYYDAVNRPPRTLPLLSFIIGRRSLSSPYAGLKTFEAIIGKRSAELSKKEDVEKVIEAAEEYAETEEIEEGIEPDEIAEKLVIPNSELLSKYHDAIAELKELANKIMENDSRLNQLIKLVDYHLKRGDKVIVFTEYKDTAEYLHNKVKDALKLDDEKIRKITSKTLSEERKKTKDPIEEIKGWLSKGSGKVLITTDVASEGLNLQSANVLIHYELPLSIVKFEQRNGRVWRLKQTKPVIIYYISLNTPIEQEILENYYNKLLSAAEGTGSAVNLADAIIYERRGVYKIINLSEEKGSIPIYLDSGDGSNKEEKVTLTDVWKSILEGDTEKVVMKIKERIDNLRRWMEKLNPYTNLAGAISKEIESVRMLAGFRDRNELKKVLDAIADKIELEGLERRKYSQGKLGDRIWVLYDVIQSQTNSDPSEFLICDNLEYNVYLFDAVVSLGRASSGTIDVLKVPIVVDSYGKLISLSEFMSNIIPSALTCNGLNPNEAKLVSEIPVKDVANQIKNAIYYLERQFMEYRESGIRSEVRDKDNWIPNKYEEIKVRLELKGGILGVKGSQGCVRDKVLDALKNAGWKVSTSGDTYRLEGKGEVRYIEIAQPNEIFIRGNGWKYTIINGVLVGVNYGV